MLAVATHNVGVLPMRNLALPLFAVAALFASGEALAQTGFGIPASDPNVCSAHGVCTGSDTCSCAAGFSGAACEIGSVPALSGRGLVVAACPLASTG